MQMCKRSAKLFVCLYTQTLSLVWILSSKSLVAEIQPETTSKSAHSNGSKRGNNQRLRKHRSLAASLRGWNVFPLESRQVSLISGSAVRGDEIATMHLRAIHFASSMFLIDVNHFFMQWTWRMTWHRHFKACVQKLFMACVRLRILFRDRLSPRPVMSTSSFCTIHLLRRNPWVRTRTLRALSVRKPRPKIPPLLIIPLTMSCRWYSPLLYLVHAFINVSVPSHLHSRKSNDGLCQLEWACRQLSSPVNVWTRSVNRSSSTPSKGFQILTSCKNSSMLLFGYWEQWTYDGLPFIHSLNKNDSCLCRYGPESRECFTAR
jgi:hypothetical protein